MRRGELKVWTEQWDDIPVVRAEGEIDLGTVDSLRCVTSEVVRQKPRSVIFDLRNVTFVDSSGLGILVATRRRLKNDPESVIVITDQPAVLQSLKITGLDRVVRVLREPCAVSNAAT
jgi:anti-sigma B factor antagonist